MSDFQGTDPAERARLELVRDEHLRRTQDEEKRYQIAKDLSDNLTVSYNTSEVIMARLLQATNAKERVYAQAVTFFSTNDSVLTALKASFTGMFGLHESTQTLNAMKEGVSRSLEVLAEIGDQVGEEAVRAGYGPTIRADAVKKLVDSVDHLPGALARDRQRDARSSRRRTRPRSAMRSRTASAASPASWRRARPCRSMADAAAPATTRGRPLPRRRPSAPAPQKLDELMLAMDVVDTLRHQENLVARELDETRREAQLIERLRQIYRGPGHRGAGPGAPGGRAGAQGKPLRLHAAAARLRPDARPGVGQPRPGRQGAARPSGGRRHRLGRVSGRAWCARRSSAPSRRARKPSGSSANSTDLLPRALEQGHQEVLAEARVDEARQRADQILADGRSALARRDAAGAKKAIGDLEELRADLRREYVLRIVSRPGEPSGV